MAHDSILLEKSLNFAARIMKLHKYLIKDKKAISNHFGMILLFVFKILKDNCGGTDTTVFFPRVSYFFADF